jgi:branched-chain amino acid transport system substrate-binding protein
VSITRLSACAAFALLLQGCSPEAPPPAAKAKAPAKSETPAKAPAAAEIVRIGLAAPLSGPQSHIGIDVRNGAQLAIARLNEEGVEIGGRKVTLELITVDDEANPATAPAVAQKLVEAGVAGVVGHFNSDVSIVASRIYADAGIPQISPGTTHAGYTRQGFKTTFRLIASDDVQGPALARFALDLGLQNIAVIDDGTSYGVGVADAFVAAAKSGGAKIVARERVTAPAGDLKALLMRVGSRRPDAIMFGGVDGLAAPLVKAMAALGMKARFMGADGIQTPRFIQLAGPAAEGVVASMPGLPRERMAGGPAFVERYRKEYNAEVQLFAPMAYDAVFVLVDAMRRAGSTKPSRFLPEVGQTRWNGVIGPIAFDGKGDLRNSPVTIYGVSRGQWEFSQILMPEDAKPPVPAAAR